MNKKLVATFTSRVLLTDQDLRRDECKGTTINPIRFTFRLGKHEKNTQ